MELQSSIADNLCVQCRAAGLPQAETHAIVNQIAKWYACNGMEWTVERLKSLHHWYITEKAGVPNIPDWVAHHSDSPKGPFRCVFSMRNTQKALAVLSLHTVFFNEQVSTKQFEKLLNGLKSAEVPDVPEVKVRSKKKFGDSHLLQYTSPTLQCLTGVIAPAGSLKFSVNSSREDKPLKKEVLARAYATSWQQLPEETVRFLKDADLLRFAPEHLIERDYPVGFDVRYKVPIGTMSCIQEPSLKARWISNPNRITEHFLTPLGEAWFSSLQQFPTDCTKNQIRGVEWAKTKLSEGVKLAAVDLKSATDCLNLKPCLDIAFQWMHGYYYRHAIDRIDEIKGKDSVSARRWSRYLLSTRHFCDVSRGNWLLDGTTYRWEVGWPLGTRPSFPLLGLVNNLVARQASLDAGLTNWTDRFRVLGDDIVMDARCVDHYTRRIQRLGGVINLDKTIVSDVAVEFAGRVIDKHGSYLKRVKVRDISDDSFMELMVNMGDQAKRLLKPRQRRVWDELKYVPGTIVPGHYSQESFGEPLSLRYLWYLKHLDRPKADPDAPNLYKTGYDARQQLALELMVALKTGYPGISMEDMHSWCIPRDIWLGVQPSKSAITKVVDGGDPRKENGKSQLQAAEAKVSDPSFVPYQTFKQTVLQDKKSGVDSPNPSTLPPLDSPPPTKKVRKKRSGRH